MTCGRYVSHGAELHVSVVMCRERCHLWQCHFLNTVLCPWLKTLKGRKLQHANERRRKVGGVSRRCQQPLSPADPLDRDHLTPLVHVNEETFPSSLQHIRYYQCSSQTFVLQLHQAFSYSALHRHSSQDVLLSPLLELLGFINTIKAK